MTAKEFFKDLTFENSDFQMVIDLSEYKGQKVKISIETTEKYFNEAEIQALCGSIKIDQSELQHQIQQLREEWDRNNE